MKWLKYTIRTVVSEIDMDGNPIEREILTNKKTLDDEFGRALAEKESYNGVIDEYDDGQPEPEAQPTEAERIAELEEALELLLSGVTE